MVGRRKQPGSWPPFADRHHAGLVLASQLDPLADRAGVVVLALPRGGVPVAAPVAAHLGAPLDLLLVRKLGAPGRAELAMGAVAQVGGRIETVRNADVLAMMAVSAEEFDQTREAEERTLRRQAETFGAGSAAIEGQVVIVVDDGLATGTTMTAAVTAVRARQPAEVVVAVPVGSAPAVRRLRALADAVVCPCLPEPFWAVGQHYRDFTQTSDEEVLATLAAAR